jgi:AraC-like DNA-binding protein
VQAFEIFIEEMQEQRPDWQHTVPSSFQTFLYLFLRELKEGRFLNTTPSQEIAPGESSIERAKAYIEAHLHQPLTSELLSGKVYMSRKSFTDHFKRESGQTFHEFLTEKRMERAQHLLSAGNWAINSVAERVGLKPTRFCAQFKTRFHVTPSEFRRQQLKLTQKR